MNNVSTYARYPGFVHICLHSAGIRPNVSTTEPITVLLNIEQTREGVVPPIGLSCKYYVSRTVNT